MAQTRSATETWPALPYDEWKDTLATLHMWLQVVGKIRLKQEMHVNHWWQVVLYVSARGLTTSAMPYKDGRAFQIDFDFIDHVVSFEECDGATISFALEAMPVAQFYAKVMESLRSLSIDVSISTKPNEVPQAIPFDQDYTHAAYDKTYAHRFWRVLLQADRLFKVFRSRFIGKVSPVHLFWGAPDLAVTRFSGRRAPPHPGGIPNLADSATREAYSHEVSSAGFWPGGYGTDAAFYSYAYPEPEGFAQAHAEPSVVYYNTQLREFMLPYDIVRQSNDPDAMVLAFLQSTYEAAATLGKWDRAALERRDNALP
jgi:Family of unknown function (DUF5996)